MDLIVRHFDGRGDKIYQYHEIESLGSQLGKKKYRDIVFVTGNQNKVEELVEHVKTKHANISILDIDLPEIQDSDVLRIVEEKCKRAYAEVNKLSSTNEGVQKERNKKSVLIEDVSLNFKALNGMPGPYIKWFLNAVGPSGLEKMLAGYDDKSAEAVCIYALMDDESKIVFCKGSVRGRITKPRGSSWGWDPVFEEERSGLTFSEMDPSMKKSMNFTHRSNAITVLKKYLTSGGEIVQ